MQSTAKFSTRGRVVIPAALRRELNLKPGSRIRVFRQGEKLILEPVAAKMAPTNPRGK
jgi:AbrB family looped-hinge helix DNA binding protein